MDQALGNPRPDDDAPLRAVTYLAPGIPLPFFELVTGCLAEGLGRPVLLAAIDRISGPMHGDDDPFAAGEADIGFVCSPSYLWLRAQPEPSVDLVPTAFVFRDPRHDGEPVYFAEVVVRADRPASAFADLAGATWGYNDECSLSGYFAVLQELQQRGRDERFLGRRVRTGSHLASIDAVLAGAVDAAAIDSTVLSFQRRERPELQQSLRVIESFGPFPIQPVVVRRGLDAAFAARVATALLGLAGCAARAGALQRFGFERCVPIDEAAYEQERRALCSLGRLPGRTQEHR